jgi:hypothetical protein
MLVSMAVICTSGAGVIVFGDGLASGSYGKLILAVSVIVLVVVAVRFVRKRAQRRSPAAVAEAAGEELPAPGSPSAPGGGAAP